MKRSSKIVIISGIIAVVIISAALAVHFRLSEMERFEIETGEEENENESASEIVGEIVSSIQNQPESEENESEEEDETMFSSYVKMVDGVQIVTINAKEFMFTPSEIEINEGKTKFILINDGVGEHELVVYEASKQEIIQQAELAEDENTIEKNILFEIEEVHPGDSGESDIITLKEGSYVMGCHIVGHYEAGMKGTIEINS